MRLLKTLLATSFSILALACAAVLASGAPAQAVTDVDSIVEACDGQSVCQFDGATIANAGELADALPEGVRVVVIPAPDQAESVSSGSLAAGIKSATGADTVIVIEDRAKDRFGVASEGDAVHIAESLNSQNAADGGEAVAAVAGSLASSESQPAGAANGGALGVWLMVAAGVVVLAASGTALALLLRRRRSARALGSSRRLERELSAALDGEDGRFVEEAIEELRRRQAAYPDLAPKLSAMTGHLAELFVRVRKRGTDQQLRLLQAKYKDTLSKLLKALDADYYGDILVNPQFWSNPEGRLGEVRLAVDSVDQQAVENIRQVNESRDLEFKVALDSLIKTVTEAKLSDVYSDREK